MYIFKKQTDRDYYNPPLSTQAVTLQMLPRPTRVFSKMVKRFDL